VLATSDEAIRARTGRGWEEWFDLLDEWGAPERSHREIARASSQSSRAPSRWNAQAVAGSYERARGLRERMKAFWRERLNTLKSQLERGESDA
jgi:hypothetical protein